MSADRQVGFGEGPIPFTSIDRYASRLGIDNPEDFRPFHRLMRAADAAYLKHRAGKTEPQQQDKSKDK